MRQEKGKLQLELKAEAARRQKGEAELRRVQVGMSRPASHPAQGRLGPQQPAQTIRMYTAPVLIRGCLPESHLTCLHSSLPSVPPWAVQEQLAFRLGEVKHLKAALKGRDGTLQDLQDRLREYEQAEGAERTAAETVRQAQGAGCGQGAGVGQGEGGSTRISATTSGSETERVRELVGGMRWV